MNGQPDDEQTIRVTRSSGTTGEARHYEDSRYVFNPEELVKLGQQLATECQIVYNLENEKKLTSADLGARIKAANSQASSTTDKINNGYDMREIEVMFLLDDPRPGIKKIMRVDNGDIIREEPMTLAEKQGKLDLR